MRRVFGQKAAERAHDQGLGFIGFTRGCRHPWCRGCPDEPDGEALFHLQAHHSAQYRRLWHQAPALGLGCSDLRVSGSGGRSLVFLGCRGVRQSRAELNSILPDSTRLHGFAVIARLLVHDKLSCPSRHGGVYMFSGSKEVLKEHLKEPL